jgi:CubicO group peptidase (beta-lactamase class C family)
VKYVFDKLMAAKPGEKFVYHSGISIMLGEVVREATGQPADEFAKQRLFEPLGISKYRWGALPNGSVHTGGGLWLRPRDMAKIGSMMLNGGRWQEKQVVSETWVRASTSQQAPYRGYGYQWWLRSFRGHDRAIDAFAAQGLGGQFIVVIPELKTIAVFTGWNDGPLIEQPFEMLQRFIVPAIDRQ